MRLNSEELELIARLVRHDRTAVSTALLMIAGIVAGHTRRLAVLAAVEDAALAAHARGTIGSRRADQIARHTRQELDRSDPPLAT
jgi:hypothetical protein